MEKNTLEELISKYKPTSVTILNNDAKTVANIFSAKKIPEEFKNRIVRCFNMFAVTSRADAFVIEVILK